MRVNERPLQAAVVITKNKLKKLFSGKIQEWTVRKSEGYLWIVGRLARLYIRLITIWPPEFLYERRSERSELEAASIYKCIYRLFIFYLDNINIFSSLFFSSDIFIKTFIYLSKYLKKHIICISICLRIHISYVH